MTPEHRPCGVCRELVDAEIGCRHWKPYLPSRTDSGRVRRPPHRANGLPRGGVAMDFTDGEL